MIWSIDCTPDGNFLVSGSQDKSIRLWDIATGTQIEERAIHNDVVYCIKVANNKIISGSKDGTIKM